MPKYKTLMLACSALMIVSCGGGSDGSTPSNQQASPPPPPPISKVTLSGQVTYDRVRHTQSASLDFTNTSILPVRGTVIEAVSGAGQIIDSTILDANGEYQLSVDAGTDIRIQVKAQLVSHSANQWDVTVSDNTNGNALYILQGELLNAGTSSEQIRDLHAAHGWTGLSYGDTRAAAPFAILDNIYTAMTSFAAIDPELDFPPLEIHWSTNNITTRGDRRIGHIGKSAYIEDGDSGAIFVVGQEDADTDEFDSHVILHEWGHYFEHQISRSDTIGGLHSLTDRLDPRVALSEGWSNALSAILTDDPIYRDSFGPSQSDGFSFNIETPNLTSPGWFNEASIGAIIYDIYDRDLDEGDEIAAGLGPIYRAMTSETYKNTPVFTTIFAFTDALQANGEISDFQIDTLLETHNISGQGEKGNQEENNGAIQTALPLYKSVVLNGEATSFCSLDDAGVFNKLGNRDFIFLNLDRDQDVTITVSQIGEDKLRDPDFNIWKAGVRLHRAVTNADAPEIFEGTLSAGSYIIEAYDAGNVRGTSSTRGDSCYQLTVEG